MSKIGERMDEARADLSTAEDKEVSWNEIARRSRLDGGHISNVRYGTRKPTPDTILKLANALGCDVTWLLWGHGKKHPPRQLTWHEEKGGEDPPPPPPKRSGIRERG